MVSFKQYLQEIFDTPVKFHKIKRASYTHTYHFTVDNKNMKVVLVIDNNHLEVEFGVVNPSGIDFFDFADPKKSYVIVNYVFEAIKQTIKHNKIDHGSISYFALEKSKIRSYNALGRRLAKFLNGSLTSRASFILITF